MIVNSNPSWDIETDILIVGAGGCGLVAAIAAAAKGVDVIVLEKLPEIGGNTALSTGMIPAANTRFQREAGISDTPEAMAEDILRQNGYQGERQFTMQLCKSSKDLVEWLVDFVGVKLELVTDFKYPGHNEFRMHAPATRTGRSLVTQLRKALRCFSNVTVATGTPATDLVVDEERNILGAAVGSTQIELIRSGKIVLACDGFGANKEMLAKYCPQISNALYYGCSGNIGDGIRMGTELGAQLDFMDSYQAHGSVSLHGVLVTWATVMNGAIIVNKHGRRFADETQGYSSFAIEVLKQPEGKAFEIFDEQTFSNLIGKFSEFDQCVKMGAIKQAGTIEEVAKLHGLDESTLRQTLNEYNTTILNGKDKFGRKTGRPLESSFYTVSIAAGLFHTQGGLKVNTHGQVLSPEGPIRNLFAGGGTVAGLSGRGFSGYLSGNGLLTALGLGKIIGETAANQILQDL